MRKKLIILLFILSSMLLSFDIESYEPLQVTTESSKESSAVVKSDKEIYFASDRHGNFDVFKKDLTTEKVTRLTTQPSNERPAFYGRKLLMISDETDVYGNIYELSEDGSQKIVYLSVGMEENPFIKDGEVIFTSGEKLGQIRYAGKKPKFTGSGIGNKAMFLPDGKLVYQSAGDTYGYSNLFTASVSDDVMSGQAQITFGTRIMTGFDASSDGSFIVFSAVSSDTNGDGRLDAKDNSVLYRIDREGEYFTDPLQLTPESYSSKEPALSSGGKIFFISDKMGSDDIWYCGMEGIIPNLKDFSAQAELSEQMYEKYRAQAILSEITGGEGVTENAELLTAALLSYNRAISFTGGTEDAKAGVYFRIAEIYGIQKKYSQAESICRILVSRFENNEKVTAEAEVKRIEFEIKRKNISEDIYGYETDDYIRYLNSLSEKYKDHEAVRTVLIKTGNMYNSLGRYTTAGSYFMRAGEFSGGIGFTGALYGLAVSSLGDGNEKASAKQLAAAVSGANDPDLKETYISGYFSFSETTEGHQERLYGLMSDESIPPEIRSYAALKTGDAAADLTGKTSAYGQVKRYFVANPSNLTLKRFSAQADLKLSKKLKSEGFADEAEGLLKYMKENYKDFDYDQYASVAGRELSMIYLGRAQEYKNSGRYDNALLTYTVAYGLDKNDPEVIRGIADCYAKLNKTGEAVRFFELEYNARPNDPYVNYALGYAYSLRSNAGGNSSKKDILTAVNYLNRSLELDSNLKYSYLTLSYCYEALYHISLKESEEQTDRNILLKGLDFITGPFKFLLKSVNIIEDTDADYTDMAVSLLGRGISLCGDPYDKELRLKMKLNLANNYYNMGEYARKQALMNYLELIGEGYIFSSEKQEALIFERVGHCMFTVGEGPAEEYYDKALEIYKKNNDRQGELRVSMRTALLYLTLEDKEGDVIGGDDAFRKYSEIILKLRSEDNTEAVNLIKRNSAFAKLTDQEYFSSAGIINEMISEGTGPGKAASSGSNMIVLNLLGLDIPVWKLDLVLGSMYSEGFEGKDEMALLYSMQASNYQNVKDYEQVKKFLEEKAEVFRKKDNKLAISLIENRLGVIEYSEKNWEESIKRFENSMKLCIDLELFNSALENENNILKSKTHLAGRTLPDTTVYSLAKGTAEILSKAENMNLKGVLSYQTYNRMRLGGPSEKYQAFRHLLKARDFFVSADSLISRIARTTELKNRMQAAVLYNLAISDYESGDILTSEKLFRKGKAAADQTLDKLLRWRYMLRAGDIETDREKRLKNWLEAEKLLSEYLPSTADYELITGWRGDIRPLYDRIISFYADSEEPEKAMNYAERYKSRTLLNYYSSRYLDYREQLHKIHIKKIRYNNDEIVRYRHRAEVLRNKDPEKYSKTIAEYENQADFYEKELTEIYDQIKKSSDERLLQFVSIEDINPQGTDEILGEYRAILSVYSLPDRDIYFFRDYRGVKSFSASKESKIPLDQIGGELEDIEHLFVIPDGSANISVSDAPGHLILTLLPSIHSLKTVTENANINYSEFKMASEYKIAEDEISAAFENGGIIFFDVPADNNPVNCLETKFTFGRGEIRVSDLLKYKVPAYAVLIGGLDEQSDPLAGIITANSLIFAGVQTVIMPAPGQDMICLQKLADKLKENAPEKDIASIIKENDISCTVFGLPGMDRASQREFASVNLRSSLVNGVRYFNSKVYEKAAVHFIQALAMARNTGDEQELNILKTLVGSLSKMKDYKRAVSYGLELIDYAEKNSLDTELIQAYDTVSKDYFRNRDYAKSIEYQNRILSAANTTGKEKLAAYDMLSVIYSYSGDYFKSIDYKKKYLDGAGLTKGDLDIFSAEADGKEAETLFNSLRNIMVSYYRAGETDSALFVYDAINNNLDIFEDVSGEAFGALLESAGLCYMKRSEYSKAEETFAEALDYFNDEKGKAPIYIDMADLYYYTDKLSSAVKYLEIADKADVSDSDRMRIYNTRSLVEVKLNDLPAAKTYSYKALEKTIESADQSGEAVARVNLAKIMILDGDISGAEKNLKKSLELAVKSGNLNAEASANFYTGEIFLNSKLKPDSALSRYRKCADISAGSGDNYFLSRALYSMGASYMALNKPDSCEAYAKKSLQLSGQLMFNDVYLSSALMLSEIYADKDNQRALDALDRLTAKAADLLETGENQLPSGQADVIFAGFDRKIHLLLSSGSVGEALTSISERDRLYSINELKNFTGLKPDKDMKIEVSVEDIRSGLEQGSALVIFTTYSDIADMLIINKDKMYLNSFDLPREISVMMSGIGSKSDFTGSAKKVYDTIFGKDALAAINGITGLVIYSSGKLKNFPFDALYDGKEFLIDKYDITETDRLSLRTEKAGHLQSISFFDPFTAESDLVFAKRESRALSDVFKNTTPVNGMEATESLFRSPMMEDYSLIHLPVHSFVLDRDSLSASGRSSYIQLSADDHNDGRLEWNEIASGDYSGKQIILSGCDTAGSTGEEYYSYFDLTGAFFESGAGSVVSSKWRTDDLAASVLMKRYFRNVARGQSNAQALSQAKRDVKLYFNPHPYFWANFKLSVR